MVCWWGRLSLIFLTDLSAQSQNAVFGHVRDGLCALVWVNSANFMVVTANIIPLDIPVVTFTQKRTARDIRVNQGKAYFVKENLALSLMQAQFCENLQT